MPPRSYLITAAVLVVLVAVSLPLTMGFSIILWYWVFAGAGCILIVLGALRIVRALNAPAWIGIALALPGLLWALDHLRSVMPTSASIVVLPFMAFSLAMLAAAAGALRLMEILGGRTLRSVSDTGSWRLPRSFPLSTGGLISRV